MSVMGRLACATFAKIYLSAPRRTPDLYPRAVMEAQAVATARRAIDRASSWSPSNVISSVHIASSQHALFFPISCPRDGLQALAHRNRFAAIKANVNQLSIIIQTHVSDYLSHPASGLNHVIQIFGIPKIIPAQFLNFGKKFCARLDTRRWLQSKLSP